MKVFIAGPRSINNLNESVCKKLQNICSKNYEVLVGDAYGIDSCVQNFLSQNNYNNVTVFASGKSVRNNYGKWFVHNVEVDSSVKGFDFYAKKDLEMAKNADIGFMIWNGESKGTFNNIINLLKMNKEVVLFYNGNNCFYDFKNIDEFVDFCDSEIKIEGKLKRIINRFECDKFVQVDLF